MSVNYVQKRNSIFRKIQTKNHRFYQAGSSVSYLSREYGVANVTIYKWIKEFSNVQVSDTEAIPVKEYEKMKKRIAELEMENEILKKLPPYSQENDRKNRYLHRKA
ncbi:MAG: transposase [Clostridiales bacterium]|nr:transposase [Clostridiales bacterium]